MKERQKEMLRKWFRRDNLIVLVLLGVLMFVVALPVREKEDSGQDGGSIFDFGGTEQRQIPSDAEEKESAAERDADYAEEQEKKLAEILSSMEGVGKVEVMLTLAESEELVVEKDSTVGRSGTDEADAAGGNRSVAQTETGEATVYSTADGVSQPYVIKTLSPRVEGVLVVAEGADTGTVNRYITQIVQALFGVEAHKVKVVPMG